MPSSLTTGAARTLYLLDLLSQVPDPRKRRGRRHRLAGLLAVGVAAVIAGSRSFAAIGQWAADVGPDVLAALGADRGPADESTYRRAFALVSADMLDQVLGAWLFTRAVRAAGRLVIVVDGKAIRGAKGKDGKAPLLVAALAHGIGAVLGQVAVDAKSNEIPAARDLLAAFADLAGAVVTLDALHTQHDTAQLILGRHADYAMTVKANMPTLFRQLKKLPWAKVPAVSTVRRTTAGVPAAPSRSSWRPPGSSSRAPPRSPSCAAPSPGTARRPSMSPTSSPATGWPTLPPWPRGSRATGRSRTSSTGSAT
jgi:DDE family transposase